MTSNTVKEFKKINSMDNLLSFLEAKGSNHDNYHHYTDIDSMIKMIDSGFFHITRGNSTTMNDQQECLVKGAYDVWNRTYIGSFAFGESENMAMWGLYGLPWEDAVRITIPRKAMRMWISEVDTIYGVSLEEDICKRYPIQEEKKIRLSDIVYISDNRYSPSSKLYWNDNSLSIKDNESLIDIDKRSEMTGFVKNDAWKYENEARIHVQFNEQINYEKIAIKLTDYIFRTMTITAGPYFSGKLLERIGKRITQIIESEQVQDSGFKHLVKYKTLCRLCKHGEFQRIER